MMIIRKILSKVCAETNVSFYFKALSLIFVIALSIGIITATLFPSEARQGVGEMSKQLQFLSEAGAIQIFWIIFLNNTIKSFLALLGGILFGIIPIIFVLINGYAIGIIGAVAIAEKGIGEVLLLTIPHGMFEIPAVLLAASYGVMLGEKFYLKIKYGEQFQPNFSLSLNVFFKFVVPILALAALIETLLGALY